MGATGVAFWARMGRLISVHVRRGMAYLARVRIWRRARSAHSLRGTFDLQYVVELLLFCATERLVLHRRRRAVIGLRVRHRHCVLAIRSPVGIVVYTVQHVGDVCDGIDGVCVAEKPGTARE